MTVLTHGPRQISVQEHMALERVLETFEKLHVRSEHQFGRLRQSVRRPLRNEISLFIPSETQQILPRNGDDLPKAWCYSLSQGGMGFISRVAELPDGITIGWHIPDGEVRWLTGLVVRRRPIPEEAYWDYGFKFKR
ncbi:hypothetical protein GC163_06300 [bacterium]|nr:hypothetical protein [bacterium]